MRLETRELYGFLEDTTLSLLYNTRVIITHTIRIHWAFHVYFIIIINNNNCLLIIELHNSVSPHKQFSFTTNFRSPLLEIVLCKDDYKQNTDYYNTTPWKARKRTPWFNLIKWNDKAPLMSCRLTSKRKIKCAAAEWKQKIVCTDIHGCDGIERTLFWSGGVTKKWVY